ncbi:alpha/beta hydrolase family protein [Bradyrhizobium erythrophlei]|uniref:Predicted dienelactone hydrolase n=1 Tax=Bradyrhizobium erythrophlei TaxID=1437360 RepID=A0A1H5F892_9BRAD|nr:dienelactone hydrolase [Bradyrhizobium erythrophlei]SED99645.1 Predicted dienelactone hydrolase [Bradyrhizobium erythrophlei]
MKFSLVPAARLRLLWSCLGLLALPVLMSPTAAEAAEAGWRQLTIPVSPTNPTAIPVALYYPTQTPARAIPMGAFTVRVAIGAPPDAKFKGLIILSHGTGGSEIGHTSLAEALAQHGYLVAALRHPGDNWEDHSIWQQPPGTFFTERPRQASRVIDALLAAPEWKDKIATDAQGPRIGAAGHSAGGYTVIALAGGQVELSRIGEHCKTDSKDDPLFCSMGGGSKSPPATTLLPPATDPRVRAVVAMAPAGVFFTAASLATIKTSTAVYAAERDRWLVPRFHAEWVAQNVPHAEFHMIPNAWHFAFMDRPGTPIQTLDGDAAADPPGFDRELLLTQLRNDLPAFFDKAFAQE